MLAWEGGAHGELYAQGGLKGLRVLKDRASHCVPRVTALAAMYRQHV